MWEDSGLCFQDLLSICFWTNSLTHCEGAVSLALLVEEGHATTYFNMGPGADRITQQFSNCSLFKAAVPRLPTTMNSMRVIPNQLRILHYKNQVNHFLNGRTEV